MTPEEARIYATVQCPPPETNKKSKQVDLTFDYDEMSPALAAAIIARGDLGKSRYGQHLMTHDGRSTFDDLFQELLDALKYAQKQVQEINERHARALGLAVFRRNTIQNVLEAMIEHAEVVDWIPEDDDDEWD